VNIESFLVSLGGKVSEGAGSRISVTVSGKTAHFHRPHPGKEKMGSSLWLTLAQN
jgi:hypothetical protein